MSTLSHLDRRPSRISNWNHVKLAHQADHFYEILLDYVGDRTKIANIGGEQETQFEEAFASLGYTYIKDKAPRLLDFMVGFQLVERNDDNTKAVGIFGFKVGKTWLYAPVFFLNGDLKGHELLYLKEQDMFVPMKENWINYVLQKKPHILGESDSRQPRELGVQQPDIRSMSIPPYNSKYGSVNIPGHYPNVASEGWMPPAIGFRGIYGALTAGGLEKSFGRSLVKHAGSLSGDMLKRYVREHVNLCKYAMHVCEQYPSIGDSLNGFYGRDFFKQALLDMRGRIKGASEGASSVVLGEYKELPLSVYKRTHVLGGPVLKQAAGPSVEIKVKDDVTITQNGPELSEEEQDQISRDGYLVKDHRTGEEVSKAYNTQIEMELTNPDATGLYEVLQKDGTFVKSVIIGNPHSNSGREKFCTTVRLDPRDWINAHRTTIFAKPNISTREDYEKWYDGLSDKESLEKDGVYLAVSENGEGSVPFRVREKLDGEGRYRIHAMDYADRHRPAYLPATDSSSDLSDYDSCMSCGPELLYLEDREGLTFRSSQNILHVPREHKILTLKKPRKDTDDMPGYPIDSQSEDTSFEPGSLSDLQLHILQKTSSLKLYCDGNELAINNGAQLTKLAGVISLIRDHGFRKKEAERMIKQAEVDRLRGDTTMFRVRYAPAYQVKQARDPYAETLGPGPMAPGIPEASMGHDQQYGNVPAHYGESSYEQVPELDSGNTDPNTYSPLPENMPDPMAMQTAQQAGQMGQKEVFDTSLITGLLKAVRQDSLVDRYIGDLLKATDRIGRILFLFYWHNDEFQDRYGKVDAPELEDTLRNAFEAVGDLTLFIKEKDVSPLMRGDMGEPDIDEAAGN